MHNYTLEHPTTIHPSLRLFQIIEIIDCLPQDLFYKVERVNTGTDAPHISICIERPEDKYTPVKTFSIYECETPENFDDFLRSLASYVKDVREQEEENNILDQLRMIAEENGWQMRIEADNEPSIKMDVILVRRETDNKTNTVTLEIPETNNRSIEKRTISVLKEKTSGTGADIPDGLLPAARRLLTAWEEYFNEDLVF